MSLWSCQSTTQSRPVASLEEPSPADRMSKSRNYNHSHFTGEGIEIQRWTGRTNKRQVVPRRNYSEYNSTPLSPSFCQWLIDKERHHLKKKFIFVLIKNTNFVTSLTYSDPGFDSLPPPALPSAWSLFSLGNTILINLYLGLLSQAPQWGVKILTTNFKTTLENNDKK